MIEDNDLNFEISEGGNLIKINLLLSIKKTLICLQMW